MEYDAELNNNKVQMSFLYEDIEELEHAKIRVIPFGIIMNIFTR